MKKFNEWMKTKILESDAGLGEPKSGRGYGYPAVNVSYTHQVRKAKRNSEGELPNRQPTPLGLDGHNYPKTFQKRPENHDQWQCLNCGEWNSEKLTDCRNCGARHGNARVNTRDSRALVIADEIEKLQKIAHSFGQSEQVLNNLKISDLDSGIPASVLEKIKELIEHLKVLKTRIV